MGSVQDARRAALRRQADQREQRLHRQRRLDSAAVEVAVALAERDAAIAAAERRAGQALHQMAAEGLTLRDAADWCGDQFTLREATRLYRLATSDPVVNDRETCRSDRSGFGPGASDGSAASPVSSSPVTETDAVAAADAGVVGQ